MRALKVRFEADKSFLVAPTARIGPVERWDTVLDNIYAITEIPDNVSNGTVLEIVHLWTRNGGGFPGGCPVSWEQIAKELKLFGFEVEICSLTKPI